MFEEEFGIEMEEDAALSVETVGSGGRVHYPSLPGTGRGRLICAEFRFSPCRLSIPPLFSKEIS